MSDFGRLRSYDRFLIPVYALVWTASTAGEVMDSAEQFQLSRQLVGMRGRWVGVGWYSPGARAVHNRAAACVAAGGGIFESQL